MIGLDSAQSFMSRRGFGVASRQEELKMFSPLILHCAHIEISTATMVEQIKNRIHGP